MDMLSNEEIRAAGLADWRKLGQGLHARFATMDFSDGVRFVTAVAAVAEEAAHAPRVAIGETWVDLKVISEDAVYRDGEGREHVVEWVTRRDLDLARRISGVAHERGVSADPSGITVIELALDTAHSDRVAPVWSALLTGGAEALGRGTIGDDVRDATGRVPILWFQDTDEHETPRQRFHLDVYVAGELAQQRIDAAVAAGASVVERQPTHTVLADPDGNRVCVNTSGA